MEKITPRMIKTLRALAAGEGAPIECGQPTKQRLVKRGLAEYVGGPTTGRERWDRDIVITEAGRQVVKGQGK